MRKIRETLRLKFDVAVSERQIAATLIPMYFIALSLVYSVSVHFGAKVL